MEPMIAVCGLICDESHCGILKAIGDPVTMQEHLDWFKREMGLDLQPKQIACSGCRGDRTKHWSADCAILQCCVDKKGLQYCSECDEFPCQRLNEWAGKSKRYAAALERLREMRRESQQGPPQRI